MKKRYKYRHKILSIPLFKEDNAILYDVVVTDINLDVDTIHIYERLRFKSCLVINFPICCGFSKIAHEDITKKRMLEIMEKDPHISSHKLRKIIGHSSASISRYYMFLRRQKI